MLIANIHLHSVRSPGVVARSGISNPYIDSRDGHKAPGGLHAGLCPEFLVAPSTFSAKYIAERILKIGQYLMLQL